MVEIMVEASAGPPRLEDPEILAPLSGGEGAT